MAASGDPLVSVVCPARDVAPWLGEAVASALVQSLDDLEVIVVDDGSTDGTAEVLEELRKRDRRVVALRQAGRGAAAARNAGLARARGRYVAFLDADDRWHPRNLERKVQLLEEDPDADLCLSGYRTIDARGRPTGWSFEPAEVGLGLSDLLVENPIGCGSVVVARREAVEAAGRFDESLPAAVDIDLWLRIAARRRGSLRYLPAALVDYRRRPGQITGDWRSLDRCWERVLEKLRALAPAELGAVERAARAHHALYLAELARRAGDARTMRRLVARAWRSPGGVARTRRGWRALALSAASLTPARPRAALLEAVRAGRRRRARAREPASEVTPGPEAAAPPDGPLRVAMIVWQFPALSETFVLNELAGLLERGHDVTVFALGVPNASEQGAHPLVRERRLLERTVYLSPGFGPLAQGAAWLRALAELSARDWARLPGLVLRRTRLARPSRPDAPREPARGWTLRPAELRHGLRIGRRGPFDIVHGQFGPLGLLAARLRVTGLLSGRLVTSFRGSDASRFVREWGKEVYAPLFREGDLFLANCDHFRRRLETLGCDAERIAVKRSGIDVERFAFRLRGAPPGGPIELLSVGRLVEKKGLADAIRAVGILAARRPGLALAYRIVGDGPLRGPLEALAARLGLEEIVGFEGALPQDGVIEQLERAHLFLAPSTTAADGDEDAPVNTLKEAMATGLPVLATAHGGIPELVEHEVSGLLVPESDPAALAAALERLIDAPQRWEALGRAGRARVEAEYDRRALDARLEALYRDARSGRMRAAHRAG